MQSNGLISGCNFHIGKIPKQLDAIDFGPAAGFAVLENGYASPELVFVSFCVSEHLQQSTIYPSIHPGPPMSQWAMLALVFFSSWWTYTTETKERRCRSKQFDCWHPQSNCCWPKLIPAPTPQDVVLGSVPNHTPLCSTMCAPVQPLNKIACGVGGRVKLNNFGDTCYDWQLFPAAHC